MTSRSISGFGWVPILKAWKVFNIQQARTSWKFFWSQIKGQWITIAIAWARPSDISVLCIFKIFTQHLAKHLFLEIVLTDNSIVYRPIANRVKVIAYSNNEQRGNISTAPVEGNWKTAGTNLFDSFTAIQKFDTEKSENYHKVIVQMFSQRIFQGIFTDRNVLNCTALKKTRLTVLFRLFTKSKIISESMENYLAVKMVSHSDHIRSQEITET